MFLKLFVVLVLTLQISLASASTKIITVAADPWCPYNCDPKEHHQGFMIDIAREALALSDYTLDYKAINWARAKVMVKNGQLDGIVGMARTPSSEPLYFFSKMALGRSQVCFFKRASDEWQYHSIDSLGERTIGWINGYLYGSDDSIDNWIRAHKRTPQIQTVSGVKVYNSLFQMLLKKRIDTFADDSSVISYEIKKQGLSGQIKRAGCSNAIDEVHLAFSLKAKDREAWASALELGIQSLQQNGRISEILKHYGITYEDWLGVSVLAEP